MNLVIFPGLNTVKTPALQAFSENKNQNTSFNGQHQRTGQAKHSRVEAFPDDYEQRINTMPEEMKILWQEKDEAENRLKETRNKARELAKEAKDKAKIALSLCNNDGKSPDGTQVATFRQDTKYPKRSYMEYYKNGENPYQTLVESALCGENTRGTLVRCTLYDGKPTKIEEFEKNGKGNTIFISPTGKVAKYTKGQKTFDRNNYNLDKELELSERYGAVVKYAENVEYRRNDRYTAKTFLLLHPAGTGELRKFAQNYEWDLSTRTKGIQADEILKADYLSHNNTVFTFAKDYSEMPYSVAKSSRKLTYGNTMNNKTYKHKIPFNYFEQDEKTTATGRKEAYSLQYSFIGGKWHKILKWT